ncbi:hypothetical protein [Bacillus sp. 165]|uniref:hypothetical protein n=1 Tax=Bacillus sp. 165 TaxID=1529117 RepID=UPI001ADB189C|nr:hypothetical protein [Bacillus sp. 165]MBO9128942.1 hypothetical protein [Bacillus sp. 165]
MALFRNIQTDFWSDAKVMEEMTPEDRYFYLYLLTNPHTKQIGVYSISKKVMAFELGYSLKQVTDLLNRFENQFHIIKYNEQTREVVLLNWGKYNLNRGGKPVEDCIKAELKQIKDISLLQLIIGKIKNHKLREIVFEFKQEYLSNDTFT